jgi:hypothetical protein
MALKKNEKRMLLLLIPVLLIFVLDRFGLFSKKKSTAVDKTKTVIKSTYTKIAEGKGASSADSRPLAAQHIDSWGRDPFATPELESQKAASARLNLKGMFWMDGKPYVLINDVVLAEGQEKKGIKVQRIEGKKVYCQRGGQSITLQWSEKK